MDKMDVRDFGELLYFFELSCGISGHVLGVKNRPPTSSGTTKVSHPLESARVFNAPRALSVVA